MFMSKKQASFGHSSKLNNKRSGVLVSRAKILLRVHAGGQTPFFSFFYVPHWNLGSSWDTQILNVLGYVCMYCNCMIHTGAPRTKCVCDEKELNPLQIAFLATFPQWYAQTTSRKLFCALSSVWIRQSFCGGLGGGGFIVPFFFWNLESNSGSSAYTTLRFPHEKRGEDRWGRFVAYQNNVTIRFKGGFFFSPTPRIAFSNLFQNI